MGNKTSKLSLRLTESERAHVNLQCEKFGIKSSEYIRRLIEQDMGRCNLNEMKTKEEFLRRKALIYEINRIGNNINQIAKNVNSGVSFEFEKTKLFTMMDKVIRLLEEKL